MGKRLATKSSTSTKHCKTHIENHFFIKRILKENSQSHRKKCRKNTWKLASFFIRFFFDFWYQKPSPKRLKIDKKSIQNRCATRSAKKAAPRRPRAPPRPPQGSQNPLQKKFPTVVFGPKMASKSFLDFLARFFPPRSDFWSLLAASGAPRDPFKIDFLTSRDLPEIPQRLIFDSSS